MKDHEQLTAKSLLEFRDGIRMVLGFRAEELVDRCIALRIAGRNEFEYARLVDQITARR